MENKEKQRQYLDYFTENGPVLELGSGAGSFLELCRERGIPAVGVDADLSSVRACRGRGLTVHQSDALAFLSRTRLRPSGIFARHIIEHFPPEQARELLRLCLRVLRKNGTLVLITPNLRNPHVAMFNFWKDPDHARPYPLPMLTEMLQDAGFRVTGSGQDRESWGRGPLRWLVRTVRSALTGLPFEAPDIFLIARRS